MLLWFVEMWVISSKVKKSYSQQQFIQNISIKAWSSFFSGFLFRRFWTLEKTILFFSYYLHQIMLLFKRRKKTLIFCNIKIEVFEPYSLTSRIARDINEKVDLLKVLSFLIGISQQYWISHNWNEGRCHVHITLCDCKSKTTGAFARAHFQATFDIRHFKQFDRIKCIKCISIHLWLTKNANTVNRAKATPLYGSCYGKMSTMAKDMIFKRKPKPISSSRDGNACCYAWTNMQGVNVQRC